MQNYGVTIHLNNNKIDLKEILNVIGKDGERSFWEVSGAECFGETAETLHKFSDENTKISGEVFIKLFQVLIRL